MGMQALTWGGLHLHRETLDPDTLRTVRHPVPLIRVYGYTTGKQEQTRVMTLTRDQLVNLIVDAAEALRTIEIAEHNERIRVAP